MGKRRRKKGKGEQDRNKGGGKGYRNRVPNILSVKVRNCVRFCYWD